MENYIPVHSTPIQYTGHPSQVDVAVLILFFNRPELFLPYLNKSEKHVLPNCFFIKTEQEGKKTCPAF